jgi:general secretion pathway protein D
MISLGTGLTVGNAARSETSFSDAGSLQGDEPVTLNFTNADIRDVIRSVMSETLKLNYAIDPHIQGQISLETASPIPKSAVLSALENALRLSNIALIKAGGIWRVLPMQAAERLSPLRLGSAGTGYETRIIPLHWTSASDIQQALDPLLPAGTIIRADAARNILVVAGTQQDLAAVDSDIATFDVDTMRGMSFALIPLRSASSKTVASELPKVLGTDTGPAAGIVHVVPLDRLNAVVVTSVQPAYVERAREWIERLDQGTEGASRRLYVYRVQNGRATDLSAVLVKALGLGEGAGPKAGAAPTSGAAAGGLQTAFGGANPLLGSATTRTPDTPTGAPIDLAQGPGGLPAGNPEETIRITADETNNALLVYANPTEWSTVQAALVQLDITPLQVYLEASIAEVTLTGQLSYGLQYFFNSGRFQFNNTSGSTGTAALSYPGFNLLYSGGSGANVILNLLGEYSIVNILSSPDLIVLNNQKAHLQVGDEVPVATQSAVSTASAGAPVVNSIAYQNTGVIMDVTPRVNSSGLVLLDISQEVSSVAQTTTSTLNSPTIQERQVNTSIGVHDGQTIALGGLIQTSVTKSDTGIPYLGDIPYLGYLFKSHTVNRSRTELLLLITPHVLRDADNATAITDEIRRKLPLITQPQLPATLE